MDLNKALRTAGILAVCAAAVAAMLPLAIVGWQHRDDMGGAVMGLRLIADRSAAIIGPLETGHDKQPASIAHSVVIANAAIAEMGKTIKAAQPVLKETEETVKAVRPVLESAKAAIDRTEPVMNAAKDAVVEIKGRITPLLDDAHGTLFQINDALPMWLDCDHNPSCAFNLYQGTAKSIQKMAQSGAKVAPQVTTDAAATVHDARTVVHRMASPWSVVVSAVKKAWKLIF